MEIPSPVRAGTLLPCTQPVNHEKAENIPPLIERAPILASPEATPRRLKDLRAKRGALREEISKTRGKRRHTVRHQAALAEMEALADEIYYLEKLLSPDSPFARIGATFMLEISRPQREDGRLAVARQVSVDPDPEERVFDAFIASLNASEPFKVTLNGRWLFRHDCEMPDDRPRCVVTIFGDASEAMLAETTIHVRNRVRFPRGNDAVVVAVLAGQPFELHLDGRPVCNGSV